jgi:COP9 signalosome complex subunit 7
LAPQQQHKLKLLTLLSLASEPHPLTYDYLTSTLAIPTPSALENLITEAIYNGLITACLSPASTPPTVHITSVAPLRDLRPNSLPEIMKVLQIWESRCSSVVGDIEAQIAGIRSSAAKRKAKEARRQEVVDTAVLSNDSPGEGGNPSGGVAGPITSAIGGNGGGFGGGRMLRSAGGVRSGSGDESSKKGKGTGSKRDLDEQQEDEEVGQWGTHGGGGEEDGGVGVGLAKMEVDEGAGSSGKTGDGTRTAKRVLGKKGL